MNNQWLRIAMESLVVFPLIVVNIEVNFFVEWRKAVRSFIGVICSSGGGPYVDRNKNGEAVAREKCN